MKQKKDTPDSTERFVQAQYIRSDGTIETYSNYMVSDRGRVGSLVDNLGNKRSVMKILKPRLSDMWGHLAVHLWTNNKVHCRAIHRIMLSSFHPEQYFSGAEVDHIDRDPANNYLSNLHWTDSKGNNANRSNMKRIRVTHLSDSHTEEFDNMEECCRAFGKSKTWCIRIVKHYNGFHKGLNILIEKI